MSVILGVLSYFGFILPGHPVIAFSGGLLCELLVACCVAHSIRMRDDDELSSM